MTGKDLLELGFEPGRAVGVALLLIPGAAKHLDEAGIKRELKAVLENPVQNAAHPYFAELARVLREDEQRPVFRERAEPAPFKIWGEGLEATAVEQIRQAARLPVAVAGALMPDAHLGYGLPIGGVLATENAVIPYAVGVDIACRMKMTVLDIPARDLEQKQDRLTRAIEAETRFGVGATFRDRREHDVMDADWSVSGVTKQNKDRAWSQLGSSGSGNHFVE